MQTIVATKCIPNELKILLHRTETVPVTVNITYPYYATGPAVVHGPGFYLKKECFEKKYFVGQGVTASSELSYWIHDEHIESMDDYFYIDCSKLVFPFTDSPSHVTKNPPTSLPHQNTNLPTSVASNAGNKIPTTVALKGHSNVSEPH